MRVAFLCATYLKPEMRHVHRQIAASAEFRPVVITQKVENADAFPWEPVRVVPRSRWRFVGRAVEQALGGGPWQVGRREVDEVLEILRADGIGVLHVFFGNVAVHWLPLFRRLKIPLVVSFHGADGTGGIATERYRAAREEVFGRAAWVVARSGALVRRVGELGCPLEKTRVVRTVVPPTGFCERPPPRDGAWIFLQAARLIPKKGIATSLRALALLEELPQGRLIIAGTGPEEGRLRELARELGIAERVEFAGFLAEEALGELYRRAHVFWHPSESVAGDVEGVPNSLLEAMAGGLPVVTTRHGGIPEIIESGVNGLLCGERDAVGLANQVRLLLADPALHRSIASGGAETVRREFGITNLLAILAEVYGSGVSSDAP